MKREILRFENIIKTQYGINILDNFRMNIFESEIVTLVGMENSGRKMVYSILEGTTNITSGIVYLLEKRIQLENKTDMQQHGIYSIRKQSNLIKQLTISENIFVIRKRKRNRIWINKKAMQKHSRMLLKEFNLEYLSKAKVKNISLSEMHLVEIVKAISQRAKLLVINDIAEEYSIFEKKRFYKILEKVKSYGCSILYITPNFEDKLSLSDRMVIIRDGQKARTLLKNELNRQLISSLLVNGAEITFNNTRETLIGNTVLKTENLSFKAGLKNISIDVSHGEIVGVLDIENKYNNLLADILTGQSGYTEGTVYLNDQIYKPGSLFEAIQSGVGFISSEHIDSAYLQHLTSVENRAIMILKRMSIGGVFINKKIIEYLIQSEACREIEISKSVDPNDFYKKTDVIYERWLLYKPKLLVCQNPGAYADYKMKEIITQYLFQAAEKKIGILICSNNIAELIFLCDRIYVLKKGRIHNMYEKADFSAIKLNELI